MRTLVGAADPDDGPTLAELAQVAAMAAEASRLAREVATTLARWGMTALKEVDDGG